MLSRLASKNAGSKALASVKLISVTPQRTIETKDITVLDKQGDPKPRYVQTLPMTLEERLFQWKRANDVFFGPERDLKNYPHPEYKVKVTETYQLGFIPTRWFMAMYPRLGVSGCYSLIWLTTLGLVSKELLILDHNFLDLVGFFALFHYIRRRWGEKIKTKLESDRQKYRTELYDVPLEKAKSTYQVDVDQVKEEITRQDAVPLIFQARKEQVELQLEIEYRQRLTEVFEAVKRRLDFQAESVRTQQTFEQNHMVNWIVSNVEKSITPQQEKDNIASCIHSLKTLSVSTAL